MSCGSREIRRIAKQKIQRSPGARGFSPQQQSSGLVLETGEKIEDGDENEDEDDGAIASHAERLIVVWLAMTLFGTTIRLPSAVRRTV